MGKQTVTINPNWQELTREQVAEDLPRKIRYIREVREQMAQVQYRGATWMTLAQSHDAAVRIAKRYNRFLNSIARAEAHRAWVEANPQLAAIQFQQQFEQGLRLIEKLIRTLNELGC